MEKLEEMEDNEEIEIFEMDEDDIILNTLDKLDNKKKDSNYEEFIKDLENNEKRKTRLERAEDKIIKKIYEKFDIKDLINEKEPVDLVYTFINYDDGDYKSRKKRELETKEILRKMKLDCDTFNTMENYLKEEKTNFYEFFVNLEITRRNLPFIRNIIIITPTPYLVNEIYHNDNQVFIINAEDFASGNTMKVFFRTNNLLYYLKDLKYLSNVFIYGGGDCLIINTIKIDDIIKNGLPKIFMEKKTLQDDKMEGKSLRYLEELNANKMFESRFNIFGKLVSMNQLNVVRKDVIKMVSKLFGDYKETVDYLVLQYLTGYYLKLYNLELKNKKASGFYQYNMGNPYERFSQNEMSYFCVNYMNRKIVPYYLKWSFINLGLMQNKDVRNIYLVGKEMKYILPTLERNINRVRWYYMDKLGKNKGKLGDDLFITHIEENIEVETIMIKLNCKNVEKVIPDILFFCNKKAEYSKEYDLLTKYKEQYKIIDVIFPKDFVRKAEMKFNIPFTKMLPYCGFEEETSGIKIGNILFKTKSLKNDLKNS